MRYHAAALVLLIALSACTAESGNSIGNDTNSLTGLYEGGQGARRDQLCLVGGGGQSRFGFVIWASEGNNSCTGKGRADRQGERLSLAMQGDESCAIEARIEGGRVTLPPTLPAGCAYYCGPGVEMTGTRFDKSGDGAEDARRAVDLVGDPLCG
ncbi:MAG: hypothetical protein JWL74_115 [Alphaproteobacteria bacterium]|nr:hypothetical protein [Alphaproteobacteria bacterium]